MNNDWKNYLQKNNAKQDDDGLFVFNSSFSNFEEEDNKDIICDLSYFSTIVIAGGDAKELIQGQFTNDVNNVDEDTSQISGFCNNKGRMIANFRLFQHQQNYFISIRSDLVERSIKHLQNYVLRAEVAIQDVSEQLIHIGVSGKNAENLLQTYIDDLKTTPNRVSHNTDYIALCVTNDMPSNTSDDIPRYEIFCSFEHAKKLWEKLSTTATAVNTAYWNHLNIKNGLPFIDSHTSENFVPQMANMDLINAISFEKGCYTGQEIVARTHYLGKQKRRTYRINITSEITPKAGEQLATDTSTENQYTGTLITVCPSAENTYEALAVIQIKSAEESSLKLQAGEAQINVLELPYPLTLPSKD